MNDPRQWVYKGVCLPEAILHHPTNVYTSQRFHRRMWSYRNNLFTPPYAQDYIHHSKTWLISEFYLTDFVEKIALTCMYDIIYTCTKCISRIF